MRLFDILDNLHAAIYSECESEYETEGNNESQYRYLPYRKSFLIPSSLCIELIVFFQ